MAKRKPLAQKIRFEVFKRDSFTCQYCGTQAPDAILEVDHIIPVSKGGTNDVLNLITACKECNRGKSNNVLSDDTVVNKMRKQAKELQERREMIEMMANWQKGLLEEHEIQFNSLEALLQSYYPAYRLSENSKRQFRKLIKTFGYSEVYTSFEIALSYYDDPAEVKRKIGGICYNRRKEREG